MKMCNDTFAAIEHAINCYLAACGHHVRDFLRAAFTINQTERYILHTIWSATRHWVRVNKGDDAARALLDLSYRDGCNDDHVTTALRVMLPL